MAKTIFRYDARGNKTLEKEFVYADGALVREYVIAWTYTLFDQIASCTEQPGTLEEKKTTYTYTRGGLILTITKPDGVVVSHAYDAFSRLASITSSDNTIDLFRN